MAKRILMLGVALIMCLGILTGCNSGLKFKVGYGQKAEFGLKNPDDYHSLITIVHSQDELKALCDEWNNPAFNEENPMYLHEFYKKIRAYDGTYFEEKVLTVYLADGGNRRNSFSVKKLTIEEKTLIVNIARKEPKGYHDARYVFTPWTFLIEVNKADVTGVTTVQVK